MSDDLRLVAEPDPALADEDIIKQRLGRWNIKVTGYDDYIPAYFFLRDADSTVRGGMLAYVWGRWLHVDTLWVEDKFRGQGWGAKLLEAAHEVGRLHSAEAAFLDTFSWQARPFYERFGYELLFEVPEFPPGHSRYFMQKRPL